MLEGIRAVYAYGTWANARILDTAEQLDPEQFTIDSDDSGSIRDILVHMASAQSAWLERWRGNLPRKLWDPLDFPNVSSLRSRWAEVEAATEEYISALREPDLAPVFSYVNFKGETWAYPLWQQLMHQANHGTQHRSEAALLLTRFGRSPGALDFLVYFDEQDPEERHRADS